MIVSFMKVYYLTCDAVAYIILIMQPSFKTVFQVLNRLNPNLEVVDIDITIRYWPLLALKCYTLLYLQMH